MSAKWDVPMRTDAYNARRYENRVEWERGRHATIGASEVSIILGIAPKSWGNARDLWIDKTGRAVLSEDRENADTVRGSRAEEHIRELFAIRHPDLKVYDGTNVIFRSKKYPWLSCSLDMVIEDERGNLYAGEIKDCRYTTHWKNGDYPLHYHYQCIAQLIVTGFSGVVLVPNISYSFGSGKFLDYIDGSSVVERHIVIRRSEVKSQFNGVIRETKKFHECVISGREPEVVIMR